MRGSVLPYIIHSCNSEDPAYPIGSIQNASIRSNGWQSLPNTHYPVEFIVDLGSKVELETLQFVSHQAKIPARVNLFYGDTIIRFRQLGSFQFSDNSHTRYSARELKSANLSKVFARFIKVSIASCHQNINNPTNQVGIVSFKIIGKGNPGAPPVTPQDDQVPKNRPSTVNAESELNERIENLEKQKKLAVEREDFVEAASIKRQLDLLKQRRDTLLQLQKAKQDAISKEDFEAANEYKEQMERILNGEDMQTPRPMSAQEPQAQPKPKVQKRPVTQFQPTELDPPGNEYDNPEKSSRSVQPKEDSARREDRNQTRVIITPQMNEETVFKPNPVHFDEDAPIKTKFQPDDEEEDQEEEIHGFKIDNLASTIPAFPPEDVPESDEPPDELKVGDRQEAQPLINLFGEDAVRRFFSKSWNLKIQGIRKLTESISGLASDYIPAFTNFCYICRHRINDNQKQVVIAALNGIREIADTHQIEPPDLTRAVMQMLNQAVSKIGGSMQQVTDAVCEFLTWMSQKRSLDVVLPIIMSPVKNPAQYKASLARINTLHDIVLLNGIDTAPGLSLKEVMGYIVPSLESPKIEVRQAVIELIVSLETMVGSKVNGFLSNINTRTLREIEKAIEKHHREEVADDDY